MIVIYNDDFLEKLRRPSNIATIKSFSLNYISKEQVSSSNIEKFKENLINKKGTQHVIGYDLFGIWDDRKHTLRLRFDFPENYISSPQTRGLYKRDDDKVDLESIFTYTAIRFYEDTDELAFVVISDTIMSPLNPYFSQTRNLLNVKFPEDALATIETTIKKDDLRFLKSYGVDLGENIYKVDESGNIMVTKESFFKMFSRTQSGMDVEAIPFVRNDGPFLDVDGRKITNQYTYRIYKNLNIYCSGLEHDCWIPTKYNLYRNYLDDGIKLYGTADYDEFTIFGNSTNRVASGTETIENILGLEFEEIENKSFEYTIDYNNNKLIYIKPSGDEDKVNMNAYTILRAHVINYDGSTVSSNEIRFYQGGREDEWKVLSKSTDYIEPVEGKDIPVFLFPWDSSNFRHTIELSTTLEINNKEDIKLTFENELLNKYFNVTWKTKKTYDLLGNFDKTKISVVLTAKTKNQDKIKWIPINEKGESELILASLEYNHFKTSFYMIQSPRVLGLRLYEFNSLGGSFTAVNKIELDATEKSKVYWMITEEKTAPTVRPWWTSYTSKENRDRGVKIESQEYLKKRSYIEKKSDEVIKYPTAEDPETPGYGKFTIVPKIAFRPDIEITGKSSSMYVPTDQEMLSGLKYMTVFDSFSIDDNGYITLNNVKVVSTDGLVQSDFSAGKNIQVGNIVTLDNELTPITRTLSTFINSVELGKEVPGITYKNATSGNAGNYAIDTKGNVTKSDGSSLATKTTVTGTTSSKTTVTTDGKLVNNLTKGTDSYYMTDAKVVGDYILDKESTSVTSLTTAVSNASLDTEQTLSETIQENTVDQVIAFIREDGTIGYTSKEEGIAVKLITDNEGKIIMDPRKAWDNRKLKPVIIYIKEEPVDVKDLEFGPITFFRVDKDEIRMFEGDNEDIYPIPTWRNMVRRAQITYAVRKKGQDPFIQIIGSDRLSDRKIKSYENGRFVNKIKHAPSSDLNISYIKRNSVVVRSNCPFKLSIKYNRGFEDTLAFDTITKEMKHYTISNDGQTMYCKDGYNSIYGRGIYINSLEADDTGNVGKLIATYNDLTETSNIIAEPFNTYKEVSITNKNGEVNKDVLSNVVLLDPGKAQTVYMSSRRTLHLEYTSTKDTIVYENGDQEPIKVSTVANRRVPINYSGDNTPRLRISKFSPIYNSKGYVTHSATLDIESSHPKYPIVPTGIVDAIPYQGGNKESLYIFEKGVKPSINITSYPGALGPKEVLMPDKIDKDDPDYPNYIYSTVTYNSDTYKLSKWNIEAESQDRAFTTYAEVGSNGDIKIIPIRWVNQNTGEVRYSIPGTTIKRIEDKPYYKIGYTPATSNITEDSELFRGFDHPILWGLVNKAAFVSNDEEVIVVNRTNRKNFVGNKSKKDSSGNNTRVLDQCLVSQNNNGYNLVGKSLYTANFPKTTDETTIGGNNYRYEFLKVGQSSTSKVKKVYSNRVVQINRGAIIDTFNANLLKLKQGDSDNDLYIELTPELLSAIGYTDPKTGRISTTIPKFGYQKIVNSFIKDIKALPEGTESCETTFSLESEYRLQYVRILESDNTFKIINTPTKLYYNYLNETSLGGDDSIFEAVNIQRLKDDSTISQGEKNTRQFDVDIAVNPIVKIVDGVAVALFKITYITEEYINGKWKYNITVIPNSELQQSSAVDIDRRFCGSIEITSRIHNILDNSNIIPQKIQDAYPKVLPLLNEANESVRGVTRPLFGTGKEQGLIRIGQEKYNLVYEETILPSEQNALDNFVPPTKVIVDIYQQKNNTILLVGNRTGTNYSGKSEVYTTAYEPGKVYEDVVTLSPQTIRLRCNSLGWVPIETETVETYTVSDVDHIKTLVDHWPVQNGDVIRFIDGSRIKTYKYETTWVKVKKGTSPLYSYHLNEEITKAQEALTSKPALGVKAKIIEDGNTKYYEFAGNNNEITPIVNNYDPVYIDTLGQVVNGVSYQFPFIEVKFSDPLKSYKPSTPELICGGIKSSYGNSAALNESLEMSIDLGNWVYKGGSKMIDTGEYFIQTENGIDVDGIPYIYWDRYENGELSNFCKLLLPERIKVNPDKSIEPVATDGYLLTDYMLSQDNLSIDKPLPSNCILFVNIDNDIDDNYLINTKHKYIVKYESSTGKLYNTASMRDRWVWNKEKESIYSEIIPFKLPSITSGLVCSTSKNNLKLYLGENSNKNVITEEVTGKSTYVDLFASEFKICTDDTIIHNIDTSIYFARKNFEQVTDGEKNYYKWYKYVDNGNGATTSQEYYLLINVDTDVTKITPSNPLIPDYTVFYQDTQKYVRGFAGEEDKILVHHKTLNNKLRLYMSDYSSKGNTNFSIRKSDSLTTDWSYEILSDTNVLESNIVPENNLRITFPPNETEDTITRLFKITTLPENGEVAHEVTLRIIQGSYLGSVHCEDTIRFNPDGTYFSGTDDSYFYFDTDIPGSELEFSIPDDYLAYAYLSIGDDTNSAYGIDFKRYRLSIKLDPNSTRKRKTKHLVIYRTYNMYDPKTGILTPNKKEIKRIKLDQGYESVYLTNPVYTQEALSGNLDVDFPIPDTICSGMISGSFRNPLVVPHDYSRPMVGDMNYTMTMGYTKCSPNNNGDWDITTLTGNELAEFLLQKDEFGNDIYKLEKKNWVIDSGDKIPSIVFENYETLLVLNGQEQQLNYPYIICDYITKEDYLNFELDIYVTITFTLLNKEYRFYSYLKKASE